MRSGRYKILLVEEKSGALVPMRVPRRQRNRRLYERNFQPPDVFEALLHSLGRLRRRGVGPSAWASTFENDPLAFLLDSMSDAFLIRTLEGDILFENRFARELELAHRAFTDYEKFENDGTPYERRGLTFVTPRGRVTVTIAKSLRR